MKSSWKLICLNSCALILCDHSNFISKEKEHPQAYNPGSATASHIQIQLFVNSFKLN